MNPDAPAVVDVPLRADLEVVLDPPALGPARDALGKRGGQGDHGFRHSTGRVIALTSPVPKGNTAFWRYFGVQSDVRIL